MSTAVSGGADLPAAAVHVVPSSHSSQSPPTPSPRLFALAWPLFLELRLGIAIGVIGTMLAARISDPAGAAFALANQLAATLFILFRIIGAGISVVITQALGGGRRAGGRCDGGRRSARAPGWAASRR